MRRWGIGLSVAALVLSGACTPPEPIEVVVEADVESRIEDGALVVTLQLSHDSDVEVLVQDAPPAVAHTGPVGLDGRPEAVETVTFGTAAAEVEGMDLDPAEGVWRLPPRSRTTIEARWETGESDAVVAETRCEGQLEVVVYFGVRAEELSELAIALC